jgi:iron complex outermembrane receptor protein
MKGPRSSSKARRRLTGPAAICGLLGVSALAAAAPGRAAEAPPSEENLTRLSIEQLMNIEVTSVAKKPQRLAEAAAAIYVITQEDIRRSGLTSIPELLRMVPGLEVAQVDARHWAIGSRGFNSVYSGKLLVLVDGRSVYSPSFAGVLWDEQDMPLEDIERIEVIRGPGGTIWGANAVDGVINIITKSAADTQGLLATVGGGTEADGSGMIRYGGPLGQAGDFRVWLKGFRHDAWVTADGADAGDSWEQARGGLRADLAPSQADAVSIEGQVYSERTNADLSLPSLAPPFATPLHAVEHDNGGDALVHWTHGFSATSELSLQAYFDRASTEEFTFRTDVDTYDLELQHHLELGDVHDIVWGAGYRNVGYDFRGNAIVSATPDHGRIQVFNMFAQDEIALAAPLHLIAGVKVEHDTFTGWQYQPSLRLVWQVAPEQTLWTAVSRSVRTPAIADERMRFNVAALPIPLPGAPPALISVFGNPSQEAEREISAEAGYRGELTSALSVDAAVFYNHYDRLASISLQAPVVEFSPPPVHLLFPVRYGNLLHADSYGGEIAINWAVTRIWRLSASYSGLAVQVGPNLSILNFPFPITIPPGTQILPQVVNSAGSSPESQFQLRSYLSLPGRTELDAAVYREGAVTDGAIPAYTRLDIRLGWRATRRLEFSLAGQNLLQGRHEEFAPLFFRTQTEVPRTVYVRATAAF